MFADWPEWCCGIVNSEQPPVIGVLIKPVWLADQMTDLVTLTSQLTFTRHVVKPEIAKKDHLGR